MFYSQSIGKYRIQSVLGTGGFGQVYLGQDPKTLKEFAIKVCQDGLMLAKEYRILKHLESIPDIIKVYELGKYTNGLYLTIEHLGRSLSYDFNDKLFSLECVSGIGYQVLSSLEHIHNKDIIHRDIKPSQFLVSLDNKLVKLIDFGMASFFRAKGVHREFKTRCKCRGTASYSSINNHLGFKQSRRDDLESLCYSLLELLKGSLPWKLNICVGGFKKWRIILKQKVSLSEDMIFNGLPPEFAALLKYSKSLNYDQTPNYLYMKSLLAKFINIEQVYSSFDWILADKQAYRHSQIVDGTTTVTKLKRGKMIVKEREKKRRSLKKELKFRKSLDGLETEIACNHQVIKRGNRKINLSEIENNGCEVSIDNGCEKLKKKPKKFKSSAFLEPPALWDKVRVSYKRNKGKKSEKLNQIKSAVELDCKEIEEAEENLKNSKSHEFVNEKSGSGNETPKNGLPEFKNRKNIFQERNFCISGNINTESESKCQVF